MSDIQVRSGQKWSGDQPYPGSEGTSRVRVMIMNGVCSKIKLGTEVCPLPEATQYREHPTKDGCTTPRWRG